jgi:competence protein ComEC
MSFKFFYVLIVLSLLFIRFGLFFLFSPQLQNGQEISFETTLLSDPQQGSRYNRLTAYYTNGFGSQRILVSYSPQIHLQYGEVVRISGRVEISLPKNNQSITTMYFPTIEAVPEKQNYLLAVLNNLRQKVEMLYFDVLSKNDANLLLGVVFGIKGSFSKQFTQDLQSAGVLHVIAASGMNVTMVSGFLFFLIGPLFPRRIGIFLCMVGVLLYAVLSGLQASIVRATIMGLIAFSAQLLGRQYAGIYGLFLAGSGMLVWDPSLFFDVGFQLSVMSTFGILVFKPLFPNNALFDDIGTTFSAQIMTLPIMLANFGTYGLLSILVNALVLWTIPPLMVLGGVGAIVGLVIEPVGAFLVWLTIPFLWFFETVVSFFGGLKWNVQVQSLPWEMVVGYYLMVFAIVVIIKRLKSLHVKKCLPREGEDPVSLSS